jgi:hypothetical protein
MVLDPHPSIRVVSVPHKQRGGEIRNGKMMPGGKPTDLKSLDFGDPIDSSASARGCSEVFPPAGTALFLADAIQYQGGAVANGASIQLIFWGSFWKDPTVSPQPAEVRAAVQMLLDSPYFFPLKQYGVTPGPLGKTLIVIKPAPPGNVSYSDITDMLWDLIGDKFPNPDEPGGNNIYVVFLPKGVGLPEQAGGAHSDTTHYDFPFKIHRAWYAWIGFAGSLDGIITTVTHEIVEAFTNPEPNHGWVNPNTDPAISEIADVCAFFSGTANGVFVAPYFSKFDNACIIPRGRSLRLFLSTKGMNGTNGIRNHLPPGMCVRAFMAT